MQELALILRSKISFVGSKDHYVAFNYILIRLSGTGVNPAGYAGDTSPPNILVGGRQREYPPILLRTFGYSRPILVALSSLSLKPISFGYKTPPIRFSQAGGQSAHKARPPQPGTRVDATATRGQIILAR